MTPIDGQSEALEDQRDQLLEKIFREPIAHLSYDPEHDMIVIEVGLVNAPGRLTTWDIENQNTEIVVGFFRNYITSLIKDLLLARK